MENSVNSKLKVKVNLTEDELKFLYDFFSSAPFDWEEVNPSLPSLMEKIDEALSHIKRTKIKWPL